MNTTVDLRCVGLCLFSSFLLTIISGCGSGLNSSSSQGILDGIKAAQETKCTTKKDESEVLVVDFPASERSNLEIMMREHVIAVEHNCKALKVLRTCQVDGEYAFKGTLVKNEEVRIESADELNSNLPFSAVKLNAKLKGEFKRGATVDLMMTSIGQQRSALTEVTPADLSGRCANATHYIFSATLGAFAMTLGDRKKINAAAKLFSFKQDADTSSKQSFTYRDGQLEACQSSDSSATSPQKGCGAILKVYLIPISQTSDEALAQTPANPKKASSEAKQVPTRQVTCPPHQEFFGGQCRNAKKQEACTLQNISSCSSQCETDKQALSCAILGYAYHTGEQVESNSRRAQYYLENGCELGEPYACYMLGSLLHQGKNYQQDYKYSAKLFDRGCQLGDGPSCYRYAKQLMKGQGVELNQELASRVYHEGCAAGYPKACTNLGKSYSKGYGVEVDLEYSFKLYRRACDGGSAQGCYNVATRYSKGKGVKQDFKQRHRFGVRSCRLGHPKACAKLENKDW